MSALSQKIAFRPACPQAGPFLDQDTFCPENKAPARNAAPRRTAFSGHVLFQKTKAPARNAEPEHHSFSRSCFCQKTKAPARNADPNTMAFLQSCFSQKTKAPARNADPRRIAYVSHLPGHRHGRGKKMFTLLRPNCDQGDQTCRGADFGSRVKISGHPLGQSASFFEIYLFRLVRGGGEGPEIRQPLVVDKL